MKSAVNSAPTTQAITTACTTSAAASSRRPAPIALATAAAIAPPMVALVICCISIIIGKTSDSPASASSPNWPTKCASTLAVTAIRITLTTRLAGASRSSVATIGPSSSRRVRAAAGEAAREAVVISSLHLGRPGVRLADQMAAPGVERVVQDHAVLQHLVVVGVDVAEAQRDREQAVALRRKVEPRGVGASHDV